MIRLWLYGAGLLALVTTLAVGAIVEQPHQSAMTAFFAPSKECAAPCFLGIRPGVTTRDEALALLRGQPWVGSVTEESPYRISWTWNGTQPTFVTNFSGGYKTAQIGFTGDVVSSIHITTTIPWGEFRSAFGAPEKQAFSMAMSPSESYLVLNAAYPTYDFEATTLTFCPLKNRRDLWYSTVLINWPITPFYGLAMAGKC